MANEAVLLFETEPPIPFTVANAGAHEKGALMKLLDPMTASGSNLNGSPTAGIVAVEKIANNGKVKVSIYRRGIFKMTASGAINIGEPIMAGTTTNPNVISVANLLNLSGARIIGHALETAADGETLAVALDVGAGSTGSA